MIPYSMLGDQIFPNIIDFWTRLTGIADAP